MKSQRMLMRSLLLAFVLISKSASAQFVVDPITGLGVGVGCFGIGGDPEVACVGEQVRCIARFTNGDVSGETWSSTEASLAVHHPSGDELSGNQIASPTPVPFGGFIDGTFIWTTRPEDVFSPVVAITGRVAASGQAGIFTGEFQAQVFVFNCTPLERLQQAQFLVANSMLVRCVPTDVFSDSTMVCGNRNGSFTTQVH